MTPYITDYFGCNVFSDKEMRRRLSPSVYARLRRVIDGREPLGLDLADEVACALKDWAVEQGATHYTHWFQPMTGATAEKHDALISPGGDGVIVDFNGKLLVKGEADASSFPSGGLRATFEARGYTAWDPTSPPFVRKDPSGSITLCIPTAFCSFDGSALDEKTPLLRSMEALNRQALRVLKHLGVEAEHVFPTVGGEQEYFLVDKEMYKRRKDLVYTGRTLFGAAPAKGQELEDQYYASMSERVQAYMRELNEELWKLGVPAKTQHYEAAPAQYELAPVFEVANIAVDHNQLIMDTMRKVADRHGFACLLHEKPFAYVNGSGKHNNWSLMTDTGRNLLKPGKNEEDNLVFLTFFLCVIAAVDEYASALRLSCSSLSNQARLGGSEAPPAIISVFTGGALCEMLDHLEKGEGEGLHQRQAMNIGVSALPMFEKDDTDRNRTSPFAFTGNKFEFRMCGSSQSLGLPNTVLCTSVAEMLMRLADQADAAEDPRKELKAALGELSRDHRRVIFNGNNYSKEWAEEARRRGLPVIESTVAALEHFADERLIDLFERHNTLCRTEMEARRIIALRSYVKHATIEAGTMLKISRQKLLPSCAKYTERLANAAGAVKSVGADNTIHMEMLRACCDEAARFKKAIDALDEALNGALSLPRDFSLQAKAMEQRVLPAMDALRRSADKLEKMVDKEYWPLPSYGEMLFCII